MRSITAVVVAVAGLLAGHGPKAPPAGARPSYQLGGAFTPAAGVGIVDRDRHARPVPGTYSICYVNAYQAQPEELSWWRRRHRRLLLTRGGRPVVDAQWDEQLLDTSTPAKRTELAAVLGGWIDGCARAGFQAVEPDNLDSWSRSGGLVTRGDNLALARLLIRRAHAAGLAIAQKNAAEVSSAGRRLGFDFAVAEECQVYGECGAYTGAYGREVIEVEYSDNGGAKNFLAACRARGSQISLEYRDRDLLPRGAGGYVERWCPAVGSAQPSSRS
jgi:hypothetical protein